MRRYIVSDKKCPEQSYEEKVGGKAKSLFELRKLPLNIPCFFVITTDAFRDFLKVNEIEECVLNLLGEKKYADIRNLIMEQDIPNDIWQEIKQTYDSYDMNMVSVRSSALLEDGKLKSFAGQFDSYLFVSFQDLKRSIKKCWASYYNDNAVEYAEQISSIYGMAVIIQEMIDAEVSGIGFSQSPVVNYENSVLIEAATGVGENIVSGIITPNQYFYSMQEQRFLNSVQNTPLSSDKAVALASDILRIRDLYKEEVDTEWCIKANEIFFLQARPITATEQRSKPYKKTLVRSLPLMRVELYAMGEYEGIKWLTDGNYYFNPLFIYENGKVAVYYNNISQKENPINMYRFMCDNYENFLEKYAQTTEACKYVEKVIAGDVSISLSDFISAVLKIYPFSSLGNLAGNLPEFLVGRVYNVFKAFREEKGELLTAAEGFLMRRASGLVKKEYLHLYYIEEAFGDTLVNDRQIQEREQGYLYFNGMLIVEKRNDEINRYLNDNQIAILDESQTEKSTPNELRGSTAYGGRIKGLVSIIESENDFCKMKQGDVLVASMTVPKFLSVMKKASAMITDEGGLLCHAAIVARELKIPTVIGTKRATSILTDGDLVEVDANNARIRILKKADPK